MSTLQQLIQLCNVKSDPHVLPRPALEPISRVLPHHAVGQSSIRVSARCVQEGGGHLQGGFPALLGRTDAQHLILPAASLHKEAALFQPLLDHGREGHLYDPVCGRRLGLCVRLVSRRRESVQRVQAAVECNAQTLRLHDALKLTAEHVCGFRALAGSALYTPTEKNVPFGQCAKYSN